MGQAVSGKSQTGCIPARQRCHDSKDMKHDKYAAEAVELLRRLIATPSVSRDEKAAADVMEDYMKGCGLQPRREANNVWAVAPDHDDSRPTLLLNAHIDTVKPVPSWTRPPFCPCTEGGRLYGLGSNDCGGGLVGLLPHSHITLPCHRSGQHGQCQYDVFQ